LARKVHNYERGDLIMSKGGSTTSAQQIPEWIEGPAKANLEKARLAGEIGYMPYYGPEVAALSPMQQSAMQNTMGAMSAFGMAPAGAQYQSSLPPTTTMGGVTGYSSGDLYDQAVAELAVRNPAQMERYGKVMNPNINPEAYTQAANAQLPEYGQVMAGSGGGSDMGSTPNYWAQREAQVGKAKAFAEQSAQNQKINDALTSFGKMGFGGILGAITGGTPLDARASVVDRNTYTTNGGRGFNDGGTGVGVGGGPVGAGGGNASRGFSYGGW
jgi:hypothetical protein